MNWMEQLVHVYEHHKELVGTFEEIRKQRITLLPVSHVMQSAQIEVLLTKDGEFQDAKVIEKENARTIIPATTQSANRANAPAPHYLHDKLQYVAGDFKRFVKDAKTKNHNELFLSQMAQWAGSEYTHPKVQAIHAYLSKGRLIEDLVGKGILQLDAEQKLMEKWPKEAEGEKPAIYKVVSAEVSSAFVRFDIIHEGFDDSFVWEDSDLFNVFIRYSEEVHKMTNGVCYVTGDIAKLTTQHGSRIRNAGDMSKLISGNDSKGFTYRGRFAEPAEAVQIGYEVSQKAHHALRWLIQRQGTNVENRYFVAFGVERAEVPEPFNSTWDMANGSGKLLGLFSNQPDAPPPSIPETEELVAQELNRALHGMQHQMKEEGLNHIVVLALDAATTGRLAIVYYQTIEATRYFSVIEKWHSSCRWLQLVKNPDSKQPIRTVGTPSTYRIAEAVYGSNADSRIKKELYTRLLPCIVEEKPLPKDIVTTIVNRVKNPFSFTNSKESWEGTLNVACALISKLYEKEGYSVAVQEDNNSRDYLFGRLLGVAEVMERGILKEREEKRATNATRYFNAFSQHPARTWMVIRRQLTPYFERLGSNATRYTKLIGQLEDRLTVEQMTDDPLGPVFLLGYSSQVQEMYTKKEEKQHVGTTAQD